MTQTKKKYEKKQQNIDESNVSKNKENLMKKRQRQKRQIFVLAPNNSGGNTKSVIGRSNSFWTWSWKMAGII